MIKAEIDALEAMKAVEDVAKTKAAELGAAQAHATTMHAQATSRTPAQSNAPSSSTLLPSLADPTDEGACALWYRNYAKKKVQEVVMLVADSGKSQSAMAATINATNHGTTYGDLTGHH
jgi:hypothetical protein